MRSIENNRRLNSMTFSGSKYEPLLKGMNSGTWVSPKAETMCMDETGMFWHLKFKLRSLILSLVATCLLIGINYHSTTTLLHKTGSDARTIPVRNTVNKFVTSETIQLKGQHLFPTLNKSGLVRKKNIGVDRQLYQLGKSKKEKDYYTLFQAIINHDEKHLMLATFETFIKACRENNITYMLYGGTLLGAYRHHGMIPWDDDIDVIVKQSDKLRLRDAISEQSGFKLFHPKGFQWKLYMNELKTLQTKPFAWPYIDIFFYTENETHIWDDKKDYSKEFSFRKSDVFPLQDRLFEGLDLPVPCNMERIISTNYEIEMCETTNFIHKHESFLPKDRRAQVSCDILRKWYNFVDRVTLESGMLNETLRTSDSVQHSKIMNKFC